MIQTFSQLSCSVYKYLVHSLTLTFKHLESEKWSEVEVGTVSSSPLWREEEEERLEHTLNICLFVAIYFTDVLLNSNR